MSTENKLSSEWLLKLYSKFDSARTSSATFHPATLGPVTFHLIDISPGDVFPGDTSSPTFRLATFCPEDTGNFVCR